MNPDEFLDMWKTGHGLPHKEVIYHTFVSVGHQVHMHTGPLEQGGLTQLSGLDLFLYADPEFIGFPAAFVLDYTETYEVDVKIPPASVTVSRVKRIRRNLND